MIARKEYDLIKRKTTALLVLRQNSAVQHWIGKRHSG